MNCFIDTVYGQSAPQDRSKLSLYSITKRYTTRSTAGGFHVPSSIEGGFAFGQ
jgi:hypothetical protein